MYKWFVIIGFSVMAVAWAAYAIYNYIAEKREKSQPKVRSKKYEQAQQTMDEYARKMADFKKKSYDKKQ